MADSAFKTQVSRDENANLVANPLWAQLTDGTQALSVTGGVLDVNATVTLETAYDDNSAWTFDSDKVNAQGFVVDDTGTNAVTENNIGLARMRTDRVQLNNLIDENGVQIEFGADGAVRVGDGTNIIEPNADGSINVVVGGAAGTPVTDFATATPGAGLSANNDYTVVGTTFELRRVEWSGSGKMKVEVQSGPIASLVTHAVGFSEKDTNGFIVFDPAVVVPVAATGTVRVIMTNRQGASVDVNSTIMGLDIA